MNITEIIQGIGVVASLLWAGEKIFDDIRHWRGGSPELRIINQQLVNSNDKIHSLLKRILGRMDGG